ncbi:MAG TPA: hypothetical protein GXZ43_03905 [Clostridiaceae bacterium]|nr:hypothetical protein [Clostridiaceae bacterium]
MKKHKWLIILLVLILAFSLMACNKKADDADQNGKDEKSEATETDATESKTVETSEESKESETEESEEVEESEKAEESEEIEESEKAEETEAEGTDETEEVGSEDTDETEEADTDQNTGDVYENEEFSVSVPEGWVASPMQSSDGEQPTDKVSLFKGSMDDPLALLKAPVINLEYGDSDIPLTKMDKKFYEDAEDIDPIEIGGKSFSGFTAKSSDLPLTCLYAEDGDKQYQIYVWTEKPGGSISLEDADVIQIIESFQGK